MKIDFNPPSIVLKSSGTHFVVAGVLRTFAHKEARACVLSMVYYKRIKRIFEMGMEMKDAWQVFARC